jgi:hypothetical protein
MPSACSPCRCAKRKSRAGVGDDDSRTSRLFFIHGPDRRVRSDATSRTNSGADGTVADNALFVNDQHNISGRGEQLSCGLSFKVTERFLCRLKLLRQQTRPLATKPFQAAELSLFQNQLHARFSSDPSKFAPSFAVGHRPSAIGRLLGDYG